MKLPCNNLTVAVIAFASPAAAVDKTKVLDTYANIAAAKFDDSLITAQRLKSAVTKLINIPSADNLTQARKAWLASRVPYQQTEVYRFGNSIVDDWEGKVNAWPLDEGLIDYVDAAYGGPSDNNQFAALNVIANPTLTLSGKLIDATKITPNLIETVLHEADGVEANVATGYHAIEFLLWGQDLNGHDHGTGQRTWTDYAMGNDCSNGNCDRRGEYLNAATDLLISDLDWMVAQWGIGGAARTSLLSDTDKGLSAILTGMGSLSYGELAGERMRLGVMLHDPEEEHDCFSDNTHNSHYFDGLGIQNVYLGEYVRIDGTIVNGPSLSDMVAAKDAEIDSEMKSKLHNTMMALGRMKTAAEAGFSYDQMLASGNAAGEALIQGGVDGLVNQTRSIERVVAILNLGQIEFEGSDSLDDPEAVFQ